MTIFRVGVSVILLAVTSLKCLAASDTCSSDRPGSASHRTLSIPEKNWGDLNDDSWVDFFCCVYTHVEPISGDTAKLVTYDGDTLEIAGDSFFDIVTTAMSTICGMVMGSDDCEQQESCIDASQNRILNIDGGKSGWDKNSWRVTVDGVMGGRSTANVEFDNIEPTMTFSGDISLVGGGFASVQRSISPSIDLRSFAGIVVEVMTAENRGQEGNNRPPLGVHIQLHDNKSSWRFAAAFAIPLASKDGIISRVYIPMEAFDRGSRAGFQCQSCNLDLSSINGVDFYVLFQDGSFDVQVQSITAVEKENHFRSPQNTFASNNAVKDLLVSTINSAGYLFNKGYIDLCLAVYSATLNAIVEASDDAISETLKSVVCDGLRLAALQTTNVEIAWNLRHTADALLADLAGVPRNDVEGWFLPKPSFYEQGKYLCMDAGFTSSTTSYVRKDFPSQKMFDGPFKEGQILKIDSSNELGRSWTENAEECARLCLIYSQCLSFYFSREAYFGAECRLSIGSRVTAGSETFSVEAAFLYDFYERNNYTSMDEPDSLLNETQPEKCLEEPCFSTSAKSGSSDLVFPSTLKSTIMFITCYTLTFYV